VDSGQLLSDAGVSAREAEVLDALAEHLTNAEIARRLTISIRTVESHVSSLLRKLGVADRRELARLAGELSDHHRDTAAPGPDGGGGPAPAAPPARVALPAPLTTFVGRAVEREALGRAVRESRLVTALGPGGVGKTRLALAVAGDLATEYAAGVWYVDLVPLTDPAAVAAAVADVLELVDVSGQSAADAVVQALAGREVLVVLDNCEHLLDGVGAFAEGLLARCPGVRLLATSRTRLLVPFERVFPVPGMSLPTAAGGPTSAADRTGGAGDLGDAVALFVERATAVGRPVTALDELRRVAEVCRALDGSALAIELAAARLPSLGLDGLEAGLDDRIRLLTGGSRLDERHSSLGATLDWSYDLATPADQALLRRAATFAASFDAAAASSVAGFAPVPADQVDAVADALGRLADESLVVVLSAASGTRYRLLESIRQYGRAKVDEAGETADLRARHLRWCRTVAADLVAAVPTHTTEPTPAGWSARFDAVAADLRLALHRLSDEPDRQHEAYEMALRLARLAFERGHSEAAQRLCERAATYADGAEAEVALRAAGDVACSRHVGEDALRLYLAAADQADDDDPRAARDLALAATLVRRGPGMFRVSPDDVDAAGLVDRARSLAGDDPVALAGIAVAEAFDASWDLDAAVASADRTAVARRAVEMSQAAGEPLLESAALDILTVEQAAGGDLVAAAASTQRRIDLLDKVQRRTDAAPEFVDAYHMAAELHTGAGALPAALEYAERLSHLPAYREGQVTGVRLAIVHGLAGDLDEVVRIGERFLADWERLGRPVVPYLALGASAVALTHGLRGDLDTRAEWLGVTAPLEQRMDCIRDGADVSSPLLEAMFLVHRGELADALAVMTLEPAALQQWSNAIWRQWYATLRAEVAVLVGHPDADDRLQLAGEYVVGNPVAEAMLARTRALVAGDAEAVAATARDLDRAACPYQAARSLVLAGGRHRSQGQDRLEVLGAAPMATP
jgi:predicted ATPase/DNA-binding CsgD family transcriptional regulator